MQVETISDVLDWTVAFHKNVKECLRHCQKKHEDERARMIISYLAEHEQRLERMIKEFHDEADPKVLKTWVYEYVDKHPIVDHAHRESPFSKLDFEHIVQQTVDYHEQVINLFDHLHSRVDTDSAIELIDTIKDAEENEIKRMVQTANRFSDM